MSDREKVIEGLKRLIANKGCITGMIEEGAE